MSRIEIVVVEITGMNRRIKAIVEERRAKNVCIVCGEKPVHKREACIACHGRYIKYQPQNKKDRLIYEAEAIADGQIGESRQGQRLKRNPLRDLAKRVRSQRS